MKQQAGGCNTLPTTLLIASVFAPRLLPIYVHWPMAISEYIEHRAGAIDCNHQVSLR